MAREEQATVGERLLMAKRYEVEDLWQRRARTEFGIRPVEKCPHDVRNIGNELCERARRRQAGSLFRTLLGFVREIPLQHFEGQTDSQFRRRMGALHRPCRVTVFSGQEVEQRADERRPGCQRAIHVREDLSQPLTPPTGPIVRESARDVVD